MKIYKFVHYRCILSAAAKSVHVRLGVCLSVSVSVYRLTQKIFDLKLEHTRK